MSSAYFQDLGLPPKDAEAKIVKTLESVGFKGVKSIQNWQSQKIDNNEKPDIAETYKRHCYLFRAQFLRHRSKFSDDLSYADHLLKSLKLTVESFSFW